MERTASGEKILKEGKPVLQFVAIQRKDNGEWAIPGVSTLQYCRCVLRMTCFTSVWLIQVKTFQQH